MTNIDPEVLQHLTFIMGQVHNHGPEAGAKYANAVFSCGDKKIYYESHGRTFEIRTRRDADAIFETIKPQIENLIKRELERK